MVLAGGEGTRVHELTQGKIPKALMTLDDGVTHIDQLLDGLEVQGFRDFTFCLGVHADMIAEHLDNRQVRQPDSRYKFSQESIPLGTGGAIHRALNTQVTPLPFLLVTADAVFPYDEIPTLRTKHREGTVTWAVSEASVSSMGLHRDMIYDKESGAILQNAHRPWMGRKHMSQAALVQARAQELTLIDGGHGVIDPKLFDRVYRMVKQLFPDNQQVCWYKNMLPMIAEMTRRRVVKHTPPLLYGYVEIKPILDMGTLETFRFANEELHKTEGFFSLVDPSRLLKNQNTVSR